MLDEMLEKEMRFSSFGVDPGISRLVFSLLPSSHSTKFNGACVDPNNSFVGNAVDCINEKIVSPAKWGEFGSQASSIQSQRDFAF